MARNPAINRWAIVDRPYGTTTPGTLGELTERLRDRTTRRERWAECGFDRQAAAADSTTRIEIPCPTTLTNTITR
jgi:hypothetical protein